MLHGLVLFATKLETADTSEVTALHNHAPPLYSAVKQFCTSVRALAFYPFSLGIHSKRQRASKLVPQTGRENRW